MSLVARRLLQHRGFRDDLVQDAGPYPERLAVPHLVDQLEQLRQALSGLRGDEQILGVRHEGQCALDLLRELLHGLVRLFYQIPLVDGNDDALAPLVGDAGDLRVLLRHAFRSVDHQDDDVRPLHRCHSADDAVALDIFFDLRLSPQSGSVDKDILLPVPYHHRVDGVPGGSRHVGDDHAVFSQEAVDDGALSDVRLPDDGDVGTGIFRILRFRCRREVGRHRLEKVSEAQAGGRRHRDRISHGQIVELVDIVLELREAVHLVHGQHHRLL